MAEEEQVRRAQVAEAVVDSGGAVAVEFPASLVAEAVEVDLAAAVDSAGAVERLLTRR